MTIGSVFREGTVEADGFHIRYIEAGTGTPLVCLHGTTGIEVSRAHEILAQNHRLIMFETPGFGSSEVNDRSSSIDELALTLAHAAGELGLGQFSILGNLFGARPAISLAFQKPELVRYLVLAAPAIYRPAGGLSPPTTPEDRLRLLYAHPERQPPMPPDDPALTAKHDALVQRLLRSANIEAIEHAMRSIVAPTLILFGTHDQITQPDLGRLYREKLPNSHLILVYDAGHMIDADRPEAFASVVDDFLQRGDGFLVSRRSGLINP